MGARSRLAISLCTIVALTSAAAAEPLTAACKKMQAASKAEQWAYDKLTSRLWSQADTFECSDLSIDAPRDRPDAPVIVAVATVIDQAPDPADAFDNHAAARVASTAYALSQLDRARLDKETSSFGPAGRKLIAKAFDRAIAIKKQFDAWRAAHGKQLGGVAYTTAFDAAVGAWTREYTEHGAELASAISTIEELDEQGRSAGCPGQLPAFQAYVKKLAPKKIDDALAALHTITSHTLMLAAIRCEASADHLEVASLLYTYLDRHNLGFDVDGPAHQIAGAIRAAFDKADKQGNAKIEKPESAGGVMIKGFLPTPRYNHPQPNESSSDRQFWGTVKATKAAKGWVTVTFAKNMIKTRSMLCSSSGGEIRQVNADGTIDYYGQCTFGPLETVDASPAPIRVPASFAAALKVGDTFRFSVIPDKAGRAALPAETYADAKQTKLAGMFGVRW